MNVEHTEHHTTHATAMDSAASQSVGARLRTAREQLGLGLDEVADRLKLRTALLQRIENDDCHGLAHAVYLRGYLISYARLVGLPTSIADEVQATCAEEPPLVSTGTISRSRYLLDRYSVSATYLILTGLLVGPAVWLATHGGLEQKFARTELLDNPAIIAAASSADPNTAATDAIAAVHMPPLASDPSHVQAPEPTPIIASMAPFVTAPAVSEPAPIAPPVAEIGGGRHVLTLKLKEASWVEVSSATGEKLEYGLLSAGTERDYRSDGTISVRLGNAEGAEILANGEAVDIAPFRRANVAHLKLFAPGVLAARVDS